MSYMPPVRQRNVEYVLLHRQQLAVTTEPYFRSLTIVSLFEYLESSDKCVLPELV